MPRHSIAVLSVMEGTQPAQIVGRVVQVAAQRSLVQDHTGSAWIDLPATLGYWIHAEGQWDGSCLSDSTLVSEHPGDITQGEWAWFQGQGGKRARHLRARARIKSAVRKFFEARDYLAVDTPLLIKAPGTDVHLAPFSVGEDHWLSTSPEFQMKRLLVGGFPKVFQFAKCFRQGEEGAQHQPEFTMVEWYQSFFAFDDMIEETEALVLSVAREVTGTSRVMRGGQDIDLSAPWERMTVSEAFSRFTSESALELAARDEEQFFRALVEDVEPNIGRGQPTVLTEWPAQFAALAALCPHDPQVAQRFEAYAGGLELCNGYGELTDANEQAGRFDADLKMRSDAGRPTFPIDAPFLEALREGMPPCSGNALGFDRLVMLLLESDTIDDVVSFPHARL